MRSKWIIFLILLGGCYPLPEQDLTSEPLDPSSADTLTQGSDNCPDSLGHLDSPTDTLQISLDGYQPLYPARPRGCTIFGNHLIAFADTLSPDSALLTLLSLTEWSDLTSANNATNPQLPIQIAQTYFEADLDQWRIPSADEARRLRTTFGSETYAFTQLNLLLATLNAPAITLTDGSTNARYLCDDGQKSFSFVSGTSITTAGSKASHYRLRLVKSIRMRVRE